MEGSKVSTDTTHYYTDSEGDVESLKDFSSDGEETLPIFCETRARYDAPPAALCLRQTKNNMPRFSPPPTPLIDDEYDIIDDAETASLSSLRLDSDFSDQLSHAELEDLKKEDEWNLDGVLKSKCHNQELNNSATHDHDPYDSFLSEDLETPRQSRLTTWRIAADHQCAPASDASRTNDLLRALFVAQDDVSLAKETILFSLIVSQLSQAGLEGLTRVESIQTPCSDERKFQAAGSVYRSEGFAIAVKRTEEVAFNNALQDDDKDADFLLIYLRDDTFDREWIRGLLQSAQAQLLPILAVVHDDVDALALIEEIGDALIQEQNIISERTLASDDSRAVRARLNLAISPRDASSTLDSIRTNCSKKPAYRSTFATMLSNKRTTPWRITLTLLGVVCSLVWVGIYGGNDAAFTRWHVDPEYRRVQLSSALGQYLHSDDFSSLNLTHLLPQASTGAGAVQKPTNITFITAEPNHILVSIPYSPRNHVYPSVSGVTAKKGNKDIAHNLTKIIDGVYAIEIDGNQALGVVTLTLLASPPVTNVTVQAKFGWRLGRLIGYDEVSSDLSVALSQNLVSANSNAKGLMNAMRSGTTEVKEQIAGQWKNLTLAPRSPLRAAMLPHLETVQKTVNTAPVTQRVTELLSDVKSVSKRFVKHLIPARSIAQGRERVLALTGRKSQVSATRKGKRDTTG